ncbi:hypothetical protein KoxyNG13_003440 [Klebsiella pasteurii]
MNLNNGSLKNIDSILFYSDELIVIDMDSSNQEQRISFLRGNECWKNINNKGIIHGNIDTGLFIGEILIDEDSYLFKLENLIKSKSNLIKTVK